MRAQSTHPLVSTCSTQKYVVILPDMRRSRSHFSCFLNHRNMDSTDATAATGTAVGSEGAAPAQDVDVSMSEEQNQQVADAAANNDDPVEGTSAAAATASSSKGPGPGDAAKCVKCMKRYGKSS